MEVFVRLMLPFGLAAIFVLAGIILDSNYQRSTPEPIAYSQSDPQRARIDTFWFNHRWLMGGCIVALTLVFGALMRRQSRSA
jgi:hypothetical protein